MGATGRTSKTRQTGDGVISGVAIEGQTVTLFHRTKANSAMSEMAFTLPRDPHPMLVPLAVEAFARGMVVDLDYEPAGARSGGVVRAFRVSRD